MLPFFARVAQPRRQVSPQPAELLPVKPIIEFDLVDRRFIDEKNVIGELDPRPNFMDLTPAQFEALVAKESRRLRDSQRSNGGLAFTKLKCRCASGSGITDDRFDLHRSNSAGL